MGSVKISLNKESEQFAQQEAKLNNEIALEVQRASLESDRRRAKFLMKQKTIKWCLIGGFALLFISYTVFGVKNTFFKKGLTQNDVANQIRQSVNVFPSEGIEGYLCNNVDDLFNKYVSKNSASFKEKYDYVNVDQNSLYVVRVRRLSNTNVQVFFSVDVATKEKDTVVDEETKQMLLNSGFGLQPTPTPTPEPTPTPTPEPTPVPTDDVINPDETTVINDVAPAAKSGQRRDENETVDETVDDVTSETEAPSETEPNDSIGDMEVVDAKTGEVTEYYINSKGVVMQRGKTSVQNYVFYIPLEFFYIYDNGTAVMSGFKPAGDMVLYSLVDIDVVDFENITPNALWAFDPEQIVDETSNSAARIKVDKILNDLYSGRDTSQDFFNYRQFNTFGASYNGITFFALYNTPNQMGYNAYVEYSITLPQGFTYQMHNYLVVEQSGSSWIITDLT